LETWNDLFEVMQQVTGRTENQSVFSNSQCIALLAGTMFYLCWSERR